MAKHRLFSALPYKPYRPKVRKTPRGLSGYLPKHAAPEGYVTLFGPRKERK